MEDVAQEEGQQGGQSAYNVIEALDQVGGISAADIKKAYRALKARWGEEAVTTVVDLFAYIACIDCLACLEKSKKRETSLRS